MRRLPAAFPSLIFLAAGAASASLLLGCTSTSTKQPVYQQESFGTTTRFSRSFPAPAASTCEAARRALLSQGYVLSEAKPELVDGRKSFQPEPENHYEIEFHVVCVADASNLKASIAFVNALQDRFALKKNSTSASVGVGAIGALSLPFGLSDDSMVKVASETIPGGTFYDRFFQLVDFYLPHDGEFVTAPAPAPAPKAAPPAVPTKPVPPAPVEPPPDLPKIPDAPVKPEASAPAPAPSAAPAPASTPDPKPATTES